MNQPPRLPLSQRKRLRELSARIVRHLEALQHVAPDAPGFAIAEIEASLGEPRIEGLVKRLLADGVLEETRRTWPGTNRERNLYRTKRTPKEGT